MSFDPFDSIDITPPSETEARLLGEFGDAMVDDATPPGPPRNAIEETMLHVQRTLGTPDTDTPIPPAIRARMRETIMHQLTSTPIVPSTMTREPFAPIPPKRSRPRPPRLRTWSATASLSVMIAIVIGLVGVLVAMRFDIPGPTAPSTSDVGQTISSDNSDLPILPDNCVPNGDPITSNDDVTGKSLSDWPKPIYTPAKPITHEQGLAIQQTYLNFLRCQDEAYSETPPTTSMTMFTPDSLSYYSDRMRYIIAAAHGAWYEPMPSPYDCQARVAELLSSFPLPVNKPTAISISQKGTDGSDNEYIPTFAPSDVYVMADGRYGAIIGTVSTAALRDPDVLSSSDYLQFVAFKKDGDRFLVDESIILLMPDTQHPIVEHGKGTPVPTEATFPRSRAIACLAY